MKKNLFRIFIVAPIFSCLGCASSNYDEFYKDARQLNIKDVEQKGLDGTKENKIIIRYPSYYDVAAKNTEAGRGLSVLSPSDVKINKELAEQRANRYDQIATGSIYLANALYQVLKDKLPSSKIVLQPVSIYRQPSGYAENDGKQYDVTYTRYFPVLPNSYVDTPGPEFGFAEYEYPGAAIYVDVKLLPTYGKPPISVIQHNGILNRYFNQSFGRWLAFEFTVKTANAVSPATNGVLATNAVTLFRDELGRGFKK